MRFLERIVLPFLQKLWRLILREYGPTTCVPEEGAGPGHYALSEQQNLALKRLQWIQTALKDDALRRTNNSNVAPVGISKSNFYICCTALLNTILCKCGTAALQGRQSLTAAERAESAVSDPAFAAAMQFAALRYFFGIMVLSRDVAERTNAHVTDSTPAESAMTEDVQQVLRRVWSHRIDLASVCRAVRRLAAILANPAVLDKRPAGEAALKILERIVDLGLGRFVGEGEPGAAPMAVVKIPLAAMGSEQRLQDVV